MKCLLLFVSLMSFSLAGHSQDATTERLYTAFDLLEAMNLEAQTKDIIDRVVEMEVQNNPGLVPFRRVLNEFYQEYLGYENIRYETAEIYASIFTTQELQSLIAFYKTDIGQKLLENSPEIFQRSSEAGVAAVQENMFRLQDMIKDESLRIQKMQEAAAAQE